MLNELKVYPIGRLLIFYCLFLACTNYLIRIFFLNDQVIHNSYAEQLSYERIEILIAHQNKWAWIGYTLLPLLYIVKFFLVSCCLLTGSMFFDIRLKFSQGFRIALLSDFVFIIPMLFKVFWFLLIQKDYLLQDIQMFSPFSLVGIFNIKSLGLLWFYPLQTLNIFELLYICSLGFWVHQFGAKSYEKGLKMVIGSYVPGLIIWVILIMFVTLNLNPTV